MSCLFLVTELIYPVSPKQQSQYQQENGLKCFSMGGKLGTFSAGAHPHITVVLFIRQMYDSYKWDIARKGNV